MLSCKFCGVISNSDAPTLWLLLSLKPQIQTWELETLAMSSTPSLIVDAHEDLAFNAQNHGRNLLQSVHELRKLEAPDSERGGATTSFPDLARGNIRVVFGTIWVNPCGSQFPLKPCYSSAEEAHSQALAQLDYYRNMESQGVISIIKTKSDLENIVNSNGSKIGIVILMEGADPIRAPSEAKEWFENGIRIVGPAWGKTRYCGGTKAPGPLTEEGHELMKEMERNGLILDCTHFAEESFFEALEGFDGPVIASHSNPRLFCPTDRHLSDEMIRKLTSKGGVIGTVLYNKFLDGNWLKGGPKNGVTLSQVVKNIVHVCEVSGSTEHCGIGSDFDGGFGYESIPAELDTVADLFKVGEALKREAGFSDGDVAKVLSGNFLNILRKALPD
jgi:membrane dipeptidase